MISAFHEFNSFLDKCSYSVGAFIVYGTVYGAIIFVVCLGLFFLFATIYDRYCSNAVDRLTQQIDQLQATIIELSGRNVEPLLRPYENPKPKPVENVPRYTSKRQVRNLEL